MNDVLDVDAVAELLHCSEYTVRNQTALGELPGVRFGRDYVYPREALMRRLTEMALEESAKTRRMSAHSGISVAPPPVARRGRKGNELPASVRAALAASSGSKNGSN